jgi:S1-C subfamily serine protease
MNALADLSLSLAALAAQAGPSLVTVQGHRFQGSGFCWKPGLVVTAEETLPERGPIHLTLPGGRVAEASRAGRDPSTDIALLRVEAPELVPLALSTAQAGPGMLALALGADEGAPVAALGVVSRAGPAWRSMRGGEIAQRIELDLRLRRGSEGGPVLLADGRAIGMAVPGPRRRVLVIPAATLDRVAERLRTDGRVPRGYLGLGLHPVAVEGGQGAMVMGVDPAGPAAAAGMLQGDIILSADGAPIASVAALIRALGPDSVGRPLRLGLRRAGEAREAVLTVGERPAA